MIKIVSGAFLVGICGYAGIKFSLTLKEKRDFLRDLISSLRQMQSFISDLSLPFPRIYQELSGPGLVGKMFLNMANSPENDPRKLWENEINKIDILNDQEKKPLKSFCEMLGAGSREHQIKHIEICIKSLEKTLSGAEERYDREGKLYKKTGLYFGILLLLILM